MFKKKNKIITAKNDPSNYISGYDIYDSLLLSLINDQNLYRESFEITIHEFRPDLIAQDIYGSSSYLGLLLLQVKLPLSSFSKGTILRVLPKTTLDSILGMI